MAEKWHLKGEQIGICNCKVSPCPCTAAGGNPTEGACLNATCFSISEGKYGAVDLSGVTLMMVAKFPGFVLDGNWEAGLVIDEKATDKQVDALQTIFGGQAGGVFGELAGLIGKFHGIDRAAIQFETSQGGEKGSFSGGKTKATYTPLMARSGRTQLVHGALAFREIIYPGKSEGGHVEHFGITSDTYYGEWSDIEFSGP